ncbi:MAG: signal recognition particle-docking protein FtsY [Gammaproteobacteria bacterium]|nr:signal recognition particle-docking protein FtsY [Gammaproteobacteria bacterium]
MEAFLSALEKTKTKFSEGLSKIFSGPEKLDTELLEEIKMLLLSSDVGAGATERIIADLAGTLGSSKITDKGVVLDKLKMIMVRLLEPVERPLVIDGEMRPYVVLVIGANGAGKTTTIAKLTKLLKSDNKIMLASGDTFRAAATNQLSLWGDLLGVPVISQGQGADSASVVFDALSSARSKGVDVLIADTAGRLENKTSLMEELKKITRVLKKIDQKAPHEILLVLDSGIGQNAIGQLREFNQMVGVSGLVLTKLDGSAKGGVIFSLAHEFRVPVRFIGLGEKEDDLKAFSAKEFVDTLLESND